MTEIQKICKIKEISVGLSGVIPTASFENLRPSYTMTVEPINGQDPDDIFNQIEEYLHSRFDLEANRARTDLLAKQYASLRFRERNGMKYPSVTSILGWSKKWYFNLKDKEGNAVDVQDALQQYAARGTIVEFMVLYFYEHGVWPNPTEYAGLNEDVDTLLGGSLCMHWADCSHEAFMEQFRDKIEIIDHNQEVFNDKDFYCGEYDIYGKYEGVESIMDIKSGQFEMSQLAAYAKCLDRPVKQLVILPVNPTDNKCGYKRPIVCKNIQVEYDKFLSSRAAFKRRFCI